MKTYIKSLCAAVIALVVGTANADHYQINFWGNQGWSYGDARWGQCYGTSGSKAIVTYDGGVEGTTIYWSAPSAENYNNGGAGSNWLWNFLADGGTDNPQPIKIKITGIPLKAYAVDIAQQGGDEGYGFNPPALNGTYYSLYDPTAISVTPNNPALKYGSTRNVNWTHGSANGNRAYPQRAFTGSTLTIESGTTANNARGNIAAIFIWEWGVDDNDSININVIGGNDTQYGDSVTTTGYLGYIPTSAAGWNNLVDMRNNAVINETYANVNEVLKGGTVAASTASVTLRAPRANVVGGTNTHASNPGKMFWGYLEDGATVEVKCVPYTQYDAYIYCSSDGDGNFGSITVNGKDYSFPSGLGDHASVKEVEGWAEPVIGRNCIRVTGLTAENLVIATAAKDGSGNTTTGIAGVQIINAGSRKSIVSGEKTASELDGQSVVLGGNLTLTIDQALATGVTIAGTEDKTLTVVGGDAADLAKIDRTSFAGTLVWNTSSVGAAVTIKNGTVNVGSTLALADGGSLVFDYSTYPIASIASAQTLTLTGTTSDYGERVSFVPPTDLCGRTMTFAYDTESQTYKLTIGLVRATAGDITLSEGDQVLNNSSVYTDADGNKTALLFDDDWIVVSHTQTVVIAETLAHKTRFRIVKGGYLVLRGMDGVNLDAVTVRVQTGGVYDLKLLNGVASVNTQPIVLAGGTLTNTGVSRGFTSNQHIGISLEANSTIDIPAGSDIVYYPPYAYNLHLNGHWLTKKGAGTFSIWQAYVTNSGVFDIQEGRINFWICRAANQRFWVNVAEGAVANIDEKFNGQYYGVMSDHIERLMGAGTVIFENGFPYNHGNFVGNNNWSGTIWIQNYSWNGWNLGNFAKANKGSKVKLTGFSGYAAGSGCDFEVILQDNGNTKAVTVSDIGDSTPYYFNKLSGSGTFTWDLTKTDATGGRIYWFKDISDYTGKLVTGDFLQFTIGGTSSGTLTPGAIMVQDGATFGATNWESKTLSATGKMTITGELGSVIATVKNKPTLNASVTLRDAQGNLSKGYCLMSRAVEGGYEVYVARAGFSIIVR